MDWPEEIKKMCAKRGWSVRWLAADIGVSQTYLQDVVNGKSPPSSLLKIKLAGRFSWDKTTDLLYELLPADAAEAWKNWDDKSTKALGEEAEKKMAVKEKGQAAVKKTTKKK